MMFWKNVRLKPDPNRRLARGRDRYNGPRSHGPVIATLKPGA